MTDVDQLRQEVRRISTKALRAQVNSLDHGADLAGLADDDHPNLLNSSRHSSEDHDGADGTAIHDNVSAEISVVAEKTVPVDADLILIEDSAASNVKKRVQLGNLGGAWGTWSPSYANLTIGNGTVVARYVQIGQTVHAYFSFVLGSTSAVGTAPTVSTPVTASSSYLTGQKVGVCSLFDNGSNEQGGIVTLASTTTFGLFYPHLNVGGIELLTETQIDASNPFTWTTGDSISFAVTFEASA